MYKNQTWNNLCVIMVLVTATHFLFLITHSQSEQSINPLSIIKRRQNHSSRNQKKKEKEIINVK